MIDAEARLIKFFTTIPKGYLLFSGGFDSSAVLGAAIKAGTELVPVWVNNGFNRSNFEEVEKQAKNLGASNIVEISVSPSDLVTNNPVNRCYYCKKQIINSVKVNSLPLFDGTTSTDNNNYRPGKKALDEAQVVSPLAELGIAKNISNELAIKFGADTHIANLESCLATRFNYYQQILPQRLNAIQKIENSIIKDSNDYNVRCRFDDPDHIRIELSHESIFNGIKKDLFQQITSIGKEVAKFVTIDTEPSRPNEYDKYIKR